jgi:SOS response associated peptidase (SRAP)
MKSGEPFCFAGLWEGWRRPGTEDWLRTCTIITCESNEFMATIHNRMPVILPKSVHEAWLAGEPGKEALTRGELETSRQARRRAWDVLQDLRAVLTKLGNVTIEVPSRKTFEAEAAILKQALSDCLRDQRAALVQLADAARQVDKAAFGSTADFGPAHQALLKALDRAEVLLQG